MKNVEKFSILIVDDEKTNLDVLSRILGDDYTVFIAKSGEAALARAATNQPDLILLDIIMPGLNGFDVIERLKANEVTRSIPVIFITGLNQAGNEEKGIQLGAVDYITKPFSSLVVKARIATQFKILRQVRLLEKSCMLDLTTGIPNCHRFELQREVEWQKAKQERTPIGLILLRINGFSECEMNGIPSDTFLLEWGDRLMATKEKSTELTCRIAENRFAVLMPGTDAEEMDRRKKRILDTFATLKSRYDEFEPMKRLTLAVGEAVLTPGENESAERLMTEAERKISSSPAF